MQTASLTMLIDLAEKEVNVCAKHFSEVNLIYKESIVKLNMLKEYRKDYMQQFTTQSQSGVSNQGYQNFQRFIAKLDEAIQGQETIVGLHACEVEDCKKTWQASQRRKMSFEVIKTSADKKASVALGKREQKQTDELAARRSSQLRK
jgi:flagellar protein FliJ